LYVEELNPANPDEVKWQSRFEPMQAIERDDPVRGAAPVKVTLRFTRHGPVIFTDKSKNKAYAVRAAWLEPGWRPTSAPSNTCARRTGTSFVAAMNRWGAPSENQVYADVDGNIGWKPGGSRRSARITTDCCRCRATAATNGPGSTTWTSLPVEANPARGWIATANHMNVPANNPVPRRSSAWSGCRCALRADKEILERPEKKSLQDMVTLQTDYLSLPARRLVLLLKDTQTQDSRVGEAITMLRNWTSG
jgi:penicillin amidase